MRNLILILTLAMLPMLSFSQSRQIDQHPFAIGIDIGFSQNGYLPMHIYYGRNRMQYGFSFGLPLTTGQRGEHYSNISWGEFPNDVRSSGTFFYPITFDIGYNVFGNLFLGAGVGYAMRVHYQNRYDNTHILGNNGLYHITRSDGGTIEYKAFASYHFPLSASSNSFYVRGFYSATMGVGASIGIAF